MQGGGARPGREIEVFYAGNVDDIDTAFARLVENRCEVLIVSPSSFFSSQRTQIAALAARRRLALYFEPIRDLPVRAISSEFVINLKTAKALASLARRKPAQGPLGRRN